MEPLSDFNEEDPAFVDSVAEDSELFNSLPNEIKHEEKANELMLSAEDYLSLAQDNAHSLDASLFNSMIPQEQYKLLCQLEQ